MNYKRIGIYSMVDKIKIFQSNKNIKYNITLYANHLLVICMFFLPIYKQPVSISFVILFLMF